MLSMEVFSFYTIWSRLCHGKLKKKKKKKNMVKANRVNIFITFCIHIDIDKI